MVTYMRTAVAALAMQGCDGGYRELHGIGVLFLDPDVISRHTLRALEASLRIRLFFKDTPFRHMDEGKSHRRLTQWMDSKTEFLAGGGGGYSMDHFIFGLTRFFASLQPMFLGEVGLLVSIPCGSQQSPSEKIHVAKYIPMFTNEQDATLWNLCMSHMEQEINEPIYDQYHVQSFFGTIR